MGCCGDPEDENDSLLDKGDVKLQRQDVCCTDVVFLVVFLAFWGGLIAVAVISIQGGDSNRLVYGYDSFGNTCGSRKNAPVVNVSLSAMDMAKNTYVMNTDASDLKNSLQLCVKKCPDRMLHNSSDVYKFYQETGSKLCRYDIAPENYQILPAGDWSKYGPCPRLPIYPSVKGRARCTPDYDAVQPPPGGPKNDQDEFVNDPGVFTKMLSDIYAVWPEIIYISLISLAMSFALIMIMNFLAAIVVYVVVICSVVGSIAGCIALWIAYANARKYKKQLKNGEVDGTEQSNAFLYLAMAISWTVITGFTLFFLFLWRDNLKSAVKLFKEGRKCVMSMPLMLVQPVWTFLCFIGFMVYWTIVLAYIVTMYDALYDKNSAEFNVNVVYWRQASQVVGFFTYHLLGLIWTVEYILAAQQFVVAGAVALWFFTRDKARARCAPLRAVKTLLFHHLGSIAFGSILLVAVKLPRWILNYTRNKLDGSESRVARLMLRCCVCCLWCLESCLKPLTQDAYTVIAIEGKSFCPATKRACEIVSGNLASIATVNTICSFVLFFGKLGVMAATCAIAVAWLDAGLDLYFPAMPVIFVSFIGYMIAACFLSVYEMVIDTLVLCYCEDIATNDGSLDKPYYMTESLMVSENPGNPDVVAAVAAEMEQLNKGDKEES